MRTLIATLSAVVLAVVTLNTASADHIPNPRLGPKGPWNNELELITSGNASTLKHSRNPSGELFVDQAGVPTMIPWKGGIRAYFQWLPTAEDKLKYFDHVAYSDFRNGSWSKPQIIKFSPGLVKHTDHPFDPAAVVLPNGKVRLYFTVRKGRNGMEIASATSSDGKTFKKDEGIRLSHRSGKLNDPTVLYFKGQWHMINPNHGRQGRGYYATSDDGLNWTPQKDLVRRRGAWLGNLIEVDGKAVFFGTGFTAETTDFKTWTTIEDNRFADPAGLVHKGKLYIIHTKI